MNPVVFQPVTGEVKTTKSFLLLMEGPRDFLSGPLINLSTSSTRFCYWEHRVWVNPLYNEGVSVLIHIGPYILLASKMVSFLLCFTSNISLLFYKFAQSAGAVEYTDCLSAEG